MTKATRARYMPEFKEEAVRQIAGGARPATAARILEMLEQVLPKPSH